MLRTVSLVGMAAQAEGRRLKASAAATGLKVGMYAAAGVMGLAAFVMLHILLWEIALLYVRPVWAAVIVLAFDVILAGVFLMLAGRNPERRQEIEARAVRDVALTGAMQSAVRGFTTQAAPLMALGGIAVAALLPRLRGRRA